MNPTAPTTDREAFAAALRASGLFPPAQFQKALADLPRSATTARAAAAALVSAGVLTQFQAERLLAGRTDGFVLGPYVIQEQVGRGAMGRVYRAKHRTLNRPVAIKVLDADLTRTPAARQAFDREVRAAARLNHPNIVTAYDADTVGERFFLVLEFVDGPNLEALVAGRGPLPVAEACDLVRQAALGLLHAHEKGMVHRDVKPANLLVCRPSKAFPGCVLKIADFGIARLQPVTPTVPPQTPAGGILGTPDYVAPEQARDPRQADHRADLYSLGGVFYFLLTGRPPFPGGSPADKVRRHQSADPEPVERLRPDVPQAVAAVVRRLMAKDPAKRFDSAAELVVELEAVAAGDAAVSFDLPPVQPGQHSFAGGQLSGTHAPAAAETSPWAQLTDESGVGTLDLGITPMPVRAPSVRRKKRRKPPADGFPVLLAAGLSAAVVAACVLGVWLCVRLSGG